MSHSLDKLYKLAGRDYRVTILYFYPDSEAFRLYGSDITCSFQYTANEHEKYEARFKTGVDEGLTGKIKVRYLGYGLSEELKNKLWSEGVNSAEIMDVSSGWPHQNLYHEEKPRTAKKITIPFKSLPKGGDNDWVYGFKKRLIKDGIGLSPYDREGYLAMKKFYDEGELTDVEVDEMTENGKLKPCIEKKYLQIKLEKGIITDEEEKRFDTLLKELAEVNREILKKELNDAGSSFVKLYLENRPLFKHLVDGIVKFVPQTLNFGKQAIYLDWQGYLHIHLRHVKEFQISKNYAGKDKLLWAANDVDHVMESVIKQINDEVQKYWEEKPNNRYSRFGDQSIYYEGDYYTVHIEAGGRLSTIYRNEKRKNLQ